jgi:hypothetical protein
VQLVKIKRERKLPCNLPERPEGDVPKMPWDIGEITDDQLMALLSEFTEWANYLSVQTADAVLEEEAIEDEIRVVLAMNRGEPGNIREARAQIEGTNEMIALRKKHRVARHRRHLIEGIFDNCVRSGNACSRELSRRISSTSPAQKRASWSAP